MRSYSGKLLQLEAHLDRLYRGARYLNIRPHEDLEPDVVYRLISGLLEKNALADRDAVVRIQLWGGTGRGYAHAERMPGNYSISVTPIPETGDPVTLAMVSIRRIPQTSLDSTLKLSNGINYIRAAKEAEEKGADDALMLTHEGMLSETTIANIFWCRNNTVYTPSAECDLLPGITRAMVIDIVKEWEGIALEEGRYAPEVLAQAEAMWICNSVREIVPVGQSGRFRFNKDHPVLNKLINQFQQRITELLEGYDGER